MTAPPPGRVLLAGLCSVTFRDDPVEVVAARAAAAGLAAVEWGGDRHVPPGDGDAVRAAVHHSDAHGLRVVSYGSYLFCDRERPDGLTAVLDTTEALGTDRVRVWCPFGTEVGAAAAERARVTDAVASVAEAAAARGLEVYLEFHGGTLTATAASTRALLDAVAAPNLATGWQPPYWAPAPALDDERADLARLAPSVAHVHVYEWAPDLTRRPLEAGADRWPGRLAAAAAAGPAPTDPTDPAEGAPRAALLEFVRDDDPAAFAADAATLQAWLAGADPQP